MLFKINRTGKRQTHSIAGDIGVMLFLLTIGAFMILPFVYAIVQSLKPLEELFIYPPQFFVRNPTIENFTNLLLRTNNMWVPFERYVFNSVVITVFGTGLSVIVCCMAAFPLAKYKFPGSAAFERIIVLSLLFVYDVTFIPQYILLSSLGMIDSVYSIIVPAIASSLGLYLMKNFMSQIPTELIEAATVDGAGTWKIFMTVVMPNVKPAWITLVILSFQALWNRDTGSYIFTEQLKNLPAIFRQISVSGTVATAGIASASAVILMLPPIIIFLFTQSKIVETMAHSGIKG
ncbi:MAG: carbohydrate ABC transporter permease [Ruminococcaceae bacterium]|nr:carbohydrate ABC transporter permease [Oscillospiraceae bacterium]